MRKSGKVPVTLLASIALVGLSGCQQKQAYEVRNCVDSQGHIVPDTDCQTSSLHSGGYHYVYGGSSGGRIGDTVSGGQGTPEEGVKVVSGEDVSRGGFGHGEGEGEGGHGGGEGAGE